MLVAGRVEESRLDLRLADTVHGTRADRVAADTEAGAEGPGAERVAAEILAQRGGLPGAAVVERDVDPSDAVAGVPGEAPDLGRWSAASLAPERGRVMIEFTTISVIGVLVAPSCEAKRCTIGNSVFGTR